MPTSKRRTKKTGGEAVTSAPAPAPIRPPGANVVVVPQPNFTLAHPTEGVEYNFRPQPGGEVVEVIRTKGRHRDIYNLPAPEARYLWKRLIDEGFERF